MDVVPDVDRRKSLDVRGLVPLVICTECSNHRGKDKSDQRVRTVKETLGGKEVE